MLDSKQALLEQIATDIKKNNICPDLAREARNLVLGEGNVDSNILFIGEAPGKKEDDLGIPFVGASGRLLNELLESVGLLRSDVYVTNIVKYRPPKNRDPSMLEKKIFLPYLVRQIKIINPKYIISLGRHSMDCLLPGHKISDVHGEVFQLNTEGLNVKFIPLYHPAAAMYNGGLRETLFNDFKKLSKIISIQK